MTNPTSANAIPTFDPIKYKETTRQQWQTAAEPWHRWGSILEQWLGSATELMLDLAGVRLGSHVLDVAAGAGEQTLKAARRVGSNGFVLATDISEKILEYAAADARAAGLENVSTRVLDGEKLFELTPASFDAVISRVGLIYFPNRQQALEGMRAVLKPGGRIAAIVYSTPEMNKFFSIPVSIIRRRAHLPPPLPGQPGPFSLGQPGVLEAALSRAGFSEVETRVVAAPLKLPSSAECVRFERESFGALHQMLSSLSAAEQEDAWTEIEQELRQYQNKDGFAGPCELLIGVGIK